MIERAPLFLACVLAGVPTLVCAAPPEEAAEPLPTGAVLRIGTVCFHHTGATHVEFSPDGKRLLTAGFDGIRLWDVATGKPIRHIPLDWLNFAGFTRDGKTIVCWNDNPQGKGVVTSGQNPRVHVLDPETGKTIHQFPLPGSQRGLRLHPNIVPGPGLGLLATKIADEPIIVYDVANGQVIHRLDSDNAKSLRAFSDGLAFSPDGKLFAGSSYANVYYVFDTATGKQVHRFEVNEKSQRNSSRDGCPLLFSPDGKTLTSGVHGDSVYLWDVTTGKLLCRLKEFNQDTFLHASFAPDGKLLCTWDRWELKGGVRLWQVPTGKLLHRFPLSCQLARFSPDGAILAVAAYNTLHLIDVSTGKTLHTMLVGCSTLSFAPDGTALAAVERLTGRLWVWRLPSGERHQAFGGEHRAVEALALATDGKSVLAWDLLGHFQWHDLSTGKELSRFALPWGKFRVAVDGKLLASQQNNHLGGEPVMLRDLATGKETCRFTPQPQNVGTEFALSPDGRLVAVGSWRHDADHVEIALYEPAQGKLIRTLEKLPLPDRRNWWYFRSLVFSPDARTLAVIGLRSILNGESHQGVFVWDVTTGKQLPDFGGKHEADGIAYSADSKCLLLAKHGQPARLVELAGGKELRTFEDTADVTGPFAFSADGRLLAAVRQSQGLRNAPIFLWDMATGQKLHVLNGHPDRVLALAFTPDSKQLISGSSDTTMLVWDLADVPKAHLPPKRYAMVEHPVAFLLALLVMLAFRYGLSFRQKTKPVREASGG